MDDGGTTRSTRLSLSLSVCLFHSAQLNLMGVPPEPFNLCIQVCLCLSFCLSVSPVRSDQCKFTLSLGAVAVPLCLSLSLSISVCFSIHFVCFNSPETVSLSLITDSLLLWFIARPRPVQQQQIDHYPAKYSIFNWSERVSIISIGGSRWSLNHRHYNHNKYLGMRLLLQVMDRERAFGKSMDRLKGAKESHRVRTTKGKSEQWLE